jgi:hypothetical protein
MSFLKREIMPLEQMRTKVTAKPMATPFFKDVVTAKVGHIPKS